MMGNLIFLIIIIIVIRNVIEKAKSDSKKGSGQNSGSRSWGDNSLAAGSRNAETGSKAAAAETVSHRTASRTASASKTAGTTVRKAAAAGAAEETDQISTTEYLRKKAWEDQKEHEEEARLEAMRLHRETGGRRAAQRHYDGDSIPRGMRLVKCGYCGAENLIGDYQDQKDFTCYFCREIL